MALFGSKRDVSLIRKLNRELLRNIISQQCSIYKPKLEETNVNIYGEGNDVRYYIGPILIPCLISREDQEHPSDDFNVDFKWNIEFRFLMDDLIESNLFLEIGDIILYQESYYEIYEITKNKYFLGKNPSYPNAPNPLNSGLENFGWNISILCRTHYTPSERVNISKERII